MTSEVVSYIEIMRSVIKRKQRKNHTAGVIFVSPPGYVYIPKPLQQWLYLLSEAARPQNLCFYIVAPNLRISAMTWRPCENSYPAFLAEISNALEAYTGYEGNSQLIADEETASDFGMQMAQRTFDENRVRQVKEPNENERMSIIDNLRFENRDGSTLDEKTHDAKFHKQLLALFKKTKEIKQTRTDVNLFPVATQAVDSKPTMVSLTLVLQSVLARKVARENRVDPKHSYQSWHEDAVRLQREVQSRSPNSDLDIRKFKTTASKGEPENAKAFEKASIAMHYVRPVTKPTLLMDRIPPWFERVREELHKDKSLFVKPLPSKVKLGSQRPARYDEQLLRSRDFMRDSATLLFMGKEMLQKTTIALFVDSTMKATSNMNNTLMDVRVMNLPCSSLEDMAEVTGKVFGPAPNPTETIPFPPVLIYSNVIDHLAL